MDEISLNYYFLEILNKNSLLEKIIIDYLITNKNNPINKINFLKFSNKKIHRELKIEIESILFNLNIINSKKDFIYIDENKLKQFINTIKIIKAISKNAKATKEDSSIIYMSPPRLITSEISDMVDGISDLIRKLACTVTKNLIIMSPYINYEGIKSILLPLKKLKKNIKLELFISLEHNDFNSLLDNLFTILPEHLIKHTNFYIYNIDNINNILLPHAKILIVDEKFGYLGSANFTFQGLKDNFELGISLNKKQCKTIVKIKSILISNEIFIKYNLKNL